MATEVLMPALSPTMTEGKIARWLKSEGEAVRAGDVLAEIETDKATMEVEAVDEGVLAKIVIPEGTDHVAVNTPIALIAGNGEDAAEAQRAPPSANGRQRAVAGDTATARPPQPAPQPAPPAPARQPRRQRPNTPVRPGRLRCARRCAMRSPKKCVATTRCFCSAKRSPNTKAPTRSARACCRSSGRDASSTRRLPSRALPGSASARVLPGCARSSNS